MLSITSSRARDRDPAGTVLAAATGVACLEIVLTLHSSCRASRTTVGAAFRLRSAQQGPQGSTPSGGRAPLRLSQPEAWIFIR
ncbi:hypothetical protein [Streptomyces sp. NPDC057623]|uniref:hypothetical protein n=1 Tax=Streptomyces sp. NPDC057623 TaxID=3346187 RepID=UPI003684B09B